MFLYGGNVIYFSIICTFHCCFLASNPFVWKLVHWLKWLGVPSTYSYIVQVFSFQCVLCSFSPFCVQCCLSCSYECKPCW
uniref:Uncharacterized protein n=1 Tax=Pyxicephalus adspersus TaxID=30357 RepID=A0AAV3AZ29_PYXAD|nr:TPA: hypothetical protein GDO54_006911 [Pyxicephalus adspersus]